jgi:hypothetical protein
MTKDSERPPRIAFRLGNKPRVVEFRLPDSPIVRAAVGALIEYDQRVLGEMGYDLAYAQEDMPKLVAGAIEPWADR